MTPREMLARAGEALTGDDNWAKAVARALGAYHPDGPRETIDPRSVSRWRTGAMEILPWAAAALPHILRDHADRLETEAGLLHDAADDAMVAADDIERALRGPRP
ncbi:MULTISPECIES: hypothetical protein [Methylobacteriaceae]|uniref:hypothetical protein n=1 Tax=Methylobacteriaceae TaxID=119045 RepID=UPI002F359DD6